jgi:hypothetical protein
MSAIDVQFHGKPTQETLMEDIQTVEAAVVGNHRIHLSHNFTNSPGQAALVVCYATCADADAEELQLRLDAIVAEFWAERGIYKIEPNLV